MSDAERRTARGSDLRAAVAVVGLTIYGAAVPVVLMRFGVPAWVAGPGIVLVIILLLASWRQRRKPPR